MNFSLENEQKIANSPDLAFIYNIFKDHIKSSFPTGSKANLNLRTIDIFPASKTIITSANIDCYKANLFTNFLWWCTKSNDGIHYDGQDIATKIQVNRKLYFIYKDTGETFFPAYDYLSHSMSNWEYFESSPSDEQDYIYNQLSLLVQAGIL